MVQFSKLRLAGFKSFVEPSELSIESGMTGVVGPNGCGKSNLVDALRWVMAETSAKEMRGSEMDDVIFGGTAEKPARNIAEVTLVLDNSDRTAPAAFNDTDTLEVTRRIQRGEGSLYKVNGRDVRARDVALLFADAASGARSTAIVSQGRVGSLVAARPTDRRALLEEAAGITGLHNRRHEAELRLRAAETNLQRLEDVLVTLDGQLDALKKQARQANRYRNLSDHIRKAEAMLLHRRWRDACAALDAARTRHSEAEALVAQLTGDAAHAATAQADASTKLPGLRQAEAEVAAALHRLAVERDGLAAEEARVVQAQRELTARRTQIEADMERERALEADASAARERLAAERSALEGARDTEAAAREETSAAVTSATTETHGLESQVNELTAEIAATEARRADLSRRQAEARDRAARLTARASELAAEIDTLRAQALPDHALQDAERARDEAQADLETAQARVAELDNARANASEAAEKAREALQAIEGQRARIRAEQHALEDLLKAGEQDMWPPLVDQITVDSGFETALGAALGDDLIAPADEGAPVHWRTLPPLSNAPALPTGVESLSTHVRGPAALMRRLSQIGVVANSAEGGALSRSLAQGQRLVARDGALWRWDGFTIKAGARTAAAARLAQRNRLTSLAAELATIDVRLEAARREAAVTREADQTAVSDAKSAQDTQREAIASLERARQDHARLAQKSAADASRLAALDETVARVRADLNEAETAQAEAAREASALADVTTHRARLDTIRANLAEARTRLLEHQSRLDRQTREAQARDRRLAEIETEDHSWGERASAAAHHREDLQTRAEAAAAELERLAHRPAEIEAQRLALADQIARTEAERSLAADALATAETDLAAKDKALKAAETALSAAREDRVRAEASVEQAEMANAAIAERIAERLNCAPEQALGIAGIEDESTLPELANLEGRLDRLQRERDNMGAVNLRAEQEAEELGEKIETMRKERDDLMAAIARLREGIAELNREGRERLLASFEAVNGHFQALFTRLFNGGRARLMLTDLENPLEAGLEIMASPPGKKLQILTLLSGGERALTALALLFAVFMTNPAPVCVLDEVDAPLDDANVDRICSLLEEIAHHSSTRFLVITHHRMTMARMDRLFGVTMPEPGMSQLVSVDLERAEAIRQTA
ncbi:MAG: chromosome segregation protein SMC [Alphaproteobacteria bacterium]